MIFVIARDSQQVSCASQRFPLPAFLIIATVRGFLLNFGVYHATRAALGLPFVVRLWHSLLSVLQADERKC